MFPTNQVGNFILARETRVWESSDMSDAKELKGKDLYDAFMALKPDKLAETDWAVKAGVNRGFFTNLKAQPISPRAANVRKLLAAINRTEADLYAAARGERPRQWADHPPTRTADAGETVGIISLDLSVSMGPGTEIEDFVESEPVQFDIAMLRSVTGAPFDRLRLIRGIGTSMEPVFMSSSRFLIDTTDRGSRLDGYYWISIEGAHGLKRLNPAGDGKWWIISENPGVDNYTIDRRAVRIEGRAVWVSRGL